MGREPTSERDRMVAGEPYFPGDPELSSLRVRGRELVARYNATSATDGGGRRALLSELFARLGEDVTIEPPFHCDYGWNIAVEERVYLNVGCVVLDCAPVRIGAGSLLGPYVQLCAVTHPLDPEERATGVERGGPITIGRDVWLAAGAIVGPGVTIGDGAVVGAGSVVLRDVPARVVAAGNPCRVMREL
jgi:maltose O-acetyltransferase